MKKIFTLLLSSIFSLSLLAFDGTKLSITANNKSNMDLKVEVDGRRFTMSDNTVILNNLAEGYHSVKIFREKRNNGWFNTLKQEVIYSSSMYMKRGFHTEISVNKNGKVSVEETKMRGRDDEYRNDDYGYDVMTSREFSQLKESLSREWFEKNRVISVKVVMDKNRFTSQQVKELLQLFSFEDYKLELAKYGYRNTVDKRNYFIVNDVFNFSSSRTELARFIRDFR